MTAPFKTKLFTAIEILGKEKKHRDTKSIFEYLQKNIRTNILKNQVEENINQMINLNLIFNKQRDQGLDLFYRTTKR